MAASFNKNGVVSCSIIEGYDKLSIIKDNIVQNPNLLPIGTGSFNKTIDSPYSITKKGAVYTTQQTSGGILFGQSGVLSLKTNTDYTVSWTCWIDTTDSTAMQAFECDLYPDSLPQINYNWTSTGATNVPKRYNVTFNSSNANMSSCCLRFFCDISSSDGYRVKYPIYFTDMKIEEGSVATPWCPNSADGYGTINQTTINNPIYTNKIIEY